MRWLWAVLVAVAVVGVGGVLLANRLYTQPGPLLATTTVIVPRGGQDGIAAALVAGGVIGPGPVFQAAAGFTKSAGALHAGEFEFPVHASVQQVLTILRAGRSVMHKLTVAEGLTALQVAALLNGTDTLDGPPAQVAEGMFLPDTYVFERGTLRSTIVQRARSAMERTLDRAWQTRAKSLPLGTPTEMLTLASIIERETARADERPHIAAVFHNRLRLHMKLQSDPTTIYAYSRTGVLDHPLTRAELDRDDPYNTYRAPALPPGPICMPGVLSLLAAARPDDAADLYFVADGTGGHAFAATQDAHLKNVARWREIERNRPR